MYQAYSAAITTAGEYGDARTGRRSEPRAGCSLPHFASSDPDLTDHLTLPFVDLLTRPTFPCRETDLSIRVTEFLPVGLEFGLIHQT